MVTVDRVNGSRAGGNRRPATPTAPPPERRQRVAYLDGIRGLAISGVIVVHWIGSRCPLGVGGYLGVDLFFVLSGYIISTMLWRSQPRGRSAAARYRTFLWRRVIRLYPALLAVVLGTVIICALLPDAAAGVPDLLVPGLLAIVQGSTFSVAGGHTSPFEMTWSLSIEWMFYLVWPLAIFAARRAGINARHAAKAVAVVAGAAYVGALFQSPNWFYFGPLARIPEMLAGGALALWVAESIGFPPLRRPRMALSIAVLLVAATAAYVMFVSVNYYVVFRCIGLPLAVCLGLDFIWLGLRTDNTLIKLLGWKPLTLLGRASYSIYLWHYVGYYLFLRPNVAEPPLIFALAAALTAGMAAVSYRCVERPFMRSERFTPARQGRRR